MKRSTRFTLEALVGSLLVAILLYLVTEPQTVEEPMTAEPVPLKVVELIRKEVPQKTPEPVEVEVSEVVVKVETIEPESLGVFSITAYTAGYESTGKTPDHPLYGVTWSGKPVTPNHTIAADLNVLPLGTKVQIEGLPHTYTVEDKGGAINGNDLDLYIPNLGEALAWGRRDLEVYVLEWGK